MGTIPHDRWGMSLSGPDEGARPGARTRYESRQYSSSGINTSSEMALGPRSAL